jgi:CheY-like chemotaxis protein
LFIKLQRGSLWCLTTLQLTLQNSMTLQATILCIDDESETLKLRKQLLEMYGYSVLTASSGIDGLRLLSEGESVDLVLLDYAMPEMTGDQVAEELKRLHPRIRVVIMSGFPDLPEGLLGTVDGFVRKGEDPETVIRTITRALASGR